jgi:Nif-specific regulatory protein
MGELVDFIIQKSKELLNVEGASVLLCDYDRGELYFPIVTGQEEIVERLKTCRFPIDSGIVGWVVREGKTAVVQDTSKDERFYGKVDEDTGFSTRSILCVPLHGRDNILGALEVVNKRNGKFTESDQHILEAIASNIAFSIERINLYEELRRFEGLPRQQNTELERFADQESWFADIVTINNNMILSIEEARQAAFTDSTVLICGETGTGKGLMAQCIHQDGLRSHGGFVPINCAAISENLLESDLFGYNKDAFAGANTIHIGRFEEANGGTLFLDEIGDMPLEIQAKMLRVLEDGIIRPIGGDQDIPVDVRVIAATHRDLDRLVAEGRFRQDLYYRLKVLQIDIPPLRERKEDIPILVNHFISYYNERLDMQIAGMEDAALEFLYRHDYPGNIRELQHLVESAMVLTKGEVITVDALPKEILQQDAPDSMLRSIRKTPFIPRNNHELKAAKAEARQRVEEEIEKLFLTELLSKTRGNVSEAARQSGMNRTWLAQLISKRQVDLSQFREGVA